MHDLPECYRIHGKKWLAVSLLFASKRENICTVGGAVQTAFMKTLQWNDSRT